MKRLIFGFAVLGILVVLLGEQRLDGAVQWKVEDGGNGHWYELVDPGVGSRPLWRDAKVLAEESTYLGVSGHLATITSQGEQDFLWNNIYSQTLKDENSAVWFGFTDNEDFGGYESVDQPNPQVDGWVWVTGEPVVYTYWANALLPANFGADGSDFAYMSSNNPIPGGWGDGRDYWNVAYFVEYDTPDSPPIPEPTSLIVWSLLGALGITVGWWRRRKVA